MIKLFLRVALAAAFLSAVADRFGYWPPDVSVWGSWEAFLDYTALINPWVPSAMIGGIAILATVAEVVLALLLLVGYRTKWAAQASALLLLLFGLAMAFTTGIKSALDYNVFTAAAAAFAVAAMDPRSGELDLWLAGRS